jgi:hypothetical protein
MVRNASAQVSLDIAQNNRSMKIPIFHITHVDNLPAILQSKGLWCFNALQSHSVYYSNIAYAGIQDQRAGITVPCGPGGNLHDYVPFYFAPRSPMLYAIKMGNVPGHQGGQTPIIYRVSSIQAVNSSHSRFVFNRRTWYHDRINGLL